MKALAILFLAVSIQLANAQEADPIGEQFFRPELIMANQQAVNLSDDQKDAIKNLMQEFQSEFMDMNWEMTDLSTELKHIISKSTIDESMALSQLTEVLELENRVKKKQITLLIRIKNTLTKQQQDKLHELRK